MPLLNELEQGGDIDIESIKQQIAQLQQGINALSDAVGASEESVVTEDEPTEEESTEEPSDESNMSALSRFHSQSAKRRMV